MDFTLNELSLNKLANKSEAIKVFVELSTLSSTLDSLGFKTMKIWNKSTFLNFEFCDNFRLGEWLKQKTYPSQSEKQKSQKLKSMITKKDAVWDEEEKALIANCPIVGIQLDNIQEISEGLKIACLYGTIALSFKTHPKWNSPVLDLIYLTEDENNMVFEQIVTVNHVSDIAHIDTHLDWLSALVSKGKIANDWIPSENYFPNQDFSNQLVEAGNWDIFRLKRKSLKTDTERSALIIEYGEKVALRNLYQSDKRVSYLNTTLTRKRIIFGAGKGKERIYLSLDLEKGGFEVCDYLGQHKGEYFFDGKKTSEAMRDHNIVVKS